MLDIDAHPMNVLQRVCALVAALGAIGIGMPCEAATQPTINHVPRAADWAALAAQSSSRASPELLINLVLVPEVSI